MVVTSSRELIALVLSEVRPLSLVDSNDDSIRLICPHEVKVLADRGAINGHVYKGQLTYIKLKRGVARNTAMRILNPLQVAASKHVTKRRQGSGSKRWVDHFEKSDSGLVGMHSRLVFPIAIPNYQLGTGKAQAPVSQVA